MKAFYNIGYRFFRMPWEGGPRSELVELVETGRLQGSTAVDLGCGTGANAIYLAQHGFATTGIDFAESAITRARVAATVAGTPVDFVVDDLTDIRRVRRTFDVLVDYGAFDDLGERDRDRYIASVIPLTHPGSQFLLWCFEWPARQWERVVPGSMALRPGEAEARFGAHFDIERVAGEQYDKGWLRGYAAYLMTRRDN